MWISAKQTHPRFITDIIFKYYMLYDKVFVYFLRAYCRIK